MDRALKEETMKIENKSAAHAVCVSTDGRKGDSFDRAVSVVSIARLRRKVKSIAALDGVKCAEVARV